MKFGDSAALRRLATLVRDEADRTAHTSSRAHAHMVSMATSASGYERASVHALGNRWSEAYAVLGRVVTASLDIADQLDDLARTLEACESQWHSARSSASAAGFSVYGDGLEVQVTAPSSATDADVHHAAHLQTHLRAAAADADAARERLRRSIASEHVAGIAELEAGRSRVPYPDTGDGGLDAALHQFLTPLAGVHRMVTPGR